MQNRFFNGGMFAQKSVNIQKTKKIMIFLSGTPEIWGYFIPGVVHNLNPGIHLPERPLSQDVTR